MSEREITDEVVGGGEGAGAGTGTAEGHVAGAVDVAEVATVAEVTEVVELTEGTEVIEVAEAIKVVEVPEMVDVPEAAQVAEAPGEVDTVDAAEVAEVVDVTAVPEVTEAAEDAEGAEVPDEADAADVAEVVEVAETTDVTEAPEVTDATEVIEVAETAAPEEVASEIVESTAGVATQDIDEAAADAPAELTAEAPTEIVPEVPTEVVSEVPAEATTVVPAEAALAATEVLAPEPAPTPAPVAPPAPLLAPVPDPAVAPFPSPELWLQPAPESALAFIEQQPPRKKVKLPWRWIGAVVTMLAVGAGCAFAVMAPPRTDLPGLKTAADGRYDFAPLVLPTLAPGQSDPGTSANTGEQHISDIRKLLLSPPKGAVVDHSLPGTTGWVSKSATLALLGNPQQLGIQLDSDGWRHTAAVAWKTPDGAETKIWLVQFIDSSAAGDAAGSFSYFNGGSTASPTTLTVPIAIQTTAEYVRVVKGSTATYYGQIQVDDTEFLIEFTAPTSVGITPFEQEIDLQTELLQ